MVKSGKWIKLYTSTLNSTIWERDDQVFRLWITMLLMADWDGEVISTVPGLARRAMLDIVDVERGLKVFLSPEDYSADGTTGERIKPIPGGWLVLNVRKYRDERTPDQLKKGEAMSRWRSEKRKKALQCSADGDRDLTGTARGLAITPGGDGITPGGNGSALPSSLPDSGSEGVRTSKPKAKKPTQAVVDRLLGFPEFWQAFDKKRSRVTAEKAWAKICPTRMYADEITAAARAYAASTPDKAYRKDPTTWLNQKCWNDELVERSNGKPKSRIRDIAKREDFDDAATSDLGFN